MKLDPHQRALWLAIIVLFAMFIGASSGLLAWRGGADVPDAILTSGGAFAATVLLGFAVGRFLAGRD